MTSARRGESRQNLLDGKVVALKPPGKQQPVAVGARAAPCGEALRGEIGIAFLPGNSQIRRTIAPQRWPRERRGDGKRDPRNFFRKERLPS